MVLAVKMHHYLKQHMTTEEVQLARKPVAFMLARLSFVLILNLMAGLAGIWPFSSTNPMFLLGLCDTPKYHVIHGYL